MTPPPLRRGSILRHTLAGFSFRRACATFSLLLAAIALCSDAQEVASDPGLTVHEWGTFTSVAGETGQAVEWFPLNAPNDLPTFVEHFRGTGFKLGLGGTLRMETPVIYFYSRHDTEVSVRVSFLHGLITEWYPSSDSIEPPASIENVVMFQHKSSGSITWNSVNVQPSAKITLPSENSPSHYYAARTPRSAPLTVNSKNGAEHEQFLFYRGVSVAVPPLSAMVLRSGQVEAMNQTGEIIPMLVYFERRGEKMGFRWLPSLPEGAILEAPLLDSNLDSLLPEFETALIAAGLFPDEASAMLDSWKDSWFEEGSRLIYIVPRSFVDSMLPLSIQPAPADIRRVFVGRTELLSAATQEAIETAVASHDKSTLAKYGRFLGPMVETILRKEPDSPHSDQLRDTLNEIYSSYLAQNATR